MTPYPEIIPGNNRTYGPGVYQGELVEYPNKDISRYRTGSQLGNGILTLPYPLITTSEKNQLAAHYLEHGKWAAFVVPDVVLSCVTQNHPFFSPKTVFVWKEPFSCTNLGSGWWEATATLRRPIRMID